MSETSFTCRQGLNYDEMEAGPQREICALMSPCPRLIPKVSSPSKTSPQELPRSFGFRILSKKPVFQYPVPLGLPEQDLSSEISGDTSMDDLALAHDKLVCTAPALPLALSTSRGRFRSEGEYKISCVPIDSKESAKVPSSQGKYAALNSASSKHEHYSFSSTTAKEGATKRKKISLRRLLPVNLIREPKSKGKGPDLSTLRDRYAKRDSKLVLLSGYQGLTDSQSYAS